jgi:hypothetical protein
MPQRRATVAQQSEPRSRFIQPRRNDDEQFRTEVQRLAVQLAETVIRREVAEGLSNAAERMARQLAAPMQRGPARTPKARRTQAPKKRKLAKPAKKPAKGSAARKSKRPTARK